LTNHFPNFLHPILTMAISQSSSPPSGNVTATLVFQLPPPNGETAFNYNTPPPGMKKSNVEPNPLEVTVTDIRGFPESTFTLDRDGFDFVAGQPAWTEPSGFTDDASIQQHYYPEVEKLLLERVPGSRRVYVFDHTIRRPGTQRTPVLFTHVDQTPDSAARRVRRHMPPEDVEALLQGRYRIINVWRTLNKGPLEKSPLAYASSATTPESDLFDVELRYDDGFIGVAASLKYSPGQKWYYASAMTPDERILLQCFDSEALKEGSGVTGGRTPHTAFDDPRTREDAEERESIEVRTLVFGS
jgi:hypothetical protein